MMQDDGARARKLLLRSLQVEMMVIGIGSDLGVSGLLLGLPFSELGKPNGLSGSSRIVGES